MSVRLTFDPDALTALCQRRGIRPLSLFGSVPKGAEWPDSDVDLLAEFELRAAPTFLNLANIERELSGLLGGRRVVLRTPDELSRYFCDQVVREAKVHHLIASTTAGAIL
jgi:uncharacterized protein